MPSYFIPFTPLERPEMCEQAYSPRLQSGMFDWAPSGGHMLTPNWTPAKSISFAVSGKQRTPKQPKNKKGS